MRAAGIFTSTSISLSLSLRQRSSRYAIRAGRNLPDKEFRYLRTVIVTAAVDWGFGSALAPLPFTVQHWAGVSPYTASCDFAGTCVCGKQSLGPLCCPRRGRSATGPLLPKIRGHFAEFLNERSPARLRLLASPTCGGLGTACRRLPGPLFLASPPAGLAGASRPCSGPCGPGSSNRPLPPSRRVRARFTILGTGRTLYRTLHRVRRCRPPLRPA